MVCCGCINRAPIENRKSDGSEDITTRHQVDVLIVHGTIITMDRNKSIYPDGYIVITDSVITDVGVYDKSVELVKAKQRIDATGKLIIPGLINTHTHAAMTLFRGLADDLELNDWLQNHIWPAEAKFINSKTVRLGTQLAIAEMLLSGTTTFNDMYFFEDVVARTAREIGMRVVIGEGLIDFPTPNCKTPEEGLKYVEKLILKWRGDPLVNVAVAPHSPYTCSLSLLKSARALADKYGLMCHIHLAETVKEVNDCQKKHGMTPVEYLEKSGILNEHTIAAHCVHLTSRDISILAEKKVKIAHNPGSNLKLASGIAPVVDMLDKGLCIGLGTDGSASNNDLNMFEEIDLTAKIHKVTRLDPTAVAAYSVLRMATIDAANALGLGDLIGSLEKGKRADICLIDSRKFHLVPLYNPISQLVYAVDGSDVNDVLINGRVVVRDRRILGLNKENLIKEVQLFADKMRKNRHVEK
ncbi:MAG: amidohydrolase [Kiritimatiellae bacterium]|nr:amidohydrolase [Kiritimatiellia bacterium]